MEIYDGDAVAPEAQMYDSAQRSQAMLRSILDSTVVSTGGAVLGSFAIYHRDARLPSQLRRLASRVRILDVNAAAPGGDPALIRADLAWYCAKRGGRNRVEWREGKADRPGHQVPAASG